MTAAASTVPLPWTGRDLMTATGGVRVCGDPDARFEGVGIDSRHHAPGRVFVAIRGANHDGHRFAPDVVAAGGRALVLARDALDAAPVERWRDQGVLLVAVADTLRALGDLARHHRRRNRARVVAITGSNGKTTTRAITATVLARRYPVSATRGNFNNAVGLPLSLFELAPHHRWAVYEIGMNHPGEIDRLAEICEPDLGVITNVGPAHLEGVGSIEGVRDAKGELVARLGPGAEAVLNADDPLVMSLAARCPAPPLLFGAAPSAAVRAADVVAAADGLRFTLHLPDGRAAVRLGTPAPFMVGNALAAAAVAWRAGLTAEEIGAGLEGFAPVAGRMTRRAAGRGVEILDDTYNANPASMAAALDTLAAAGGTGRRAAVLGDMRELGPRSAALHRELGQRAAAAGIHRLWATGELAPEVAAGARAAGMDPGCVAVGSKTRILEALLDWLAPGDRLLVKGSRAMAMESLVADLVERLREE